MKSEDLCKELAKTRSASRKELIFQHIVTDSREQSVLNAYKMKGEIIKNTPQSPTHLHIATNEPLIVLAEGKYNHCPGATMSPGGRKLGNVSYPSLPSR
jgi:hypothetical protein